jgi:hypothetical protein
VREDARILGAGVHVVVGTPGTSPSRDGTAHLFLYLIILRTLLTSAVFNQLHSH